MPKYGTGELHYNEYGEYGPGDGCHYLDVEKRGE